MNGLFGKIVGAINKDQTPGFILGDPIPSPDVAGIWSLHHASAREGGAPALAMLFDPARPASTSSYGIPKPALAKAGLSQLKRLKHPDVLKYLDSAEHADGTIFVATEPATPLAAILSSPAVKLDREEIQWGLFTVSRALGFLHQSGLIHGRVNAASVFVTPNGDWKLGGLEAVTPHASAAALSQHVALQPAPYQSPEYANGNWGAVASAAPSAVDSWSLGCLIFHAHSGSLNSPDQLRNTQSIPKQLLTAYQKLLASNPTTRAPAAQVPTHPYFKNSKFIELNVFVENLALKGELEREAFLTKLPSLMDKLPDAFCTFKILPMLSQSIETGRGAGPAFACVVKMKNRLSEKDFRDTVVKGHAVKWYGNAALDRAMRVDLYAQMELFAQYFDSNAVNNIVFPAMASSFQDPQAPALRDNAVKAVLCLVPVLTEKNLNSYLMSHFARLQVDPEPAVRTNTTVCLGRIASRLNQTTRNKVLIPAFLRALKDPFPPARAAGANAILLTNEMFTPKDIATRILPAVVPLMVDLDTDVRNLGFKLLATVQPVLDRNHAEMTRASERASANAQATGSDASAANGGGAAGHAARGGTSTAAGSSWGLSSFGSMTAALLTSKGDTATTASRAASGGISSEDFKHGSTPGFASNAALSSVASSADRMSSMRTKATTGPHVPAAFSTVPLVAQANGSGTGEEDEFGQFQISAPDGGANNAEADDDDGDGWGDMDVKEGSSGRNDDEDDILAMLGPPLSARKPLPGGIASSATAKVAGGSQKAAAASTVARKPSPSLPTHNPVMGFGSRGVGARRTAKKPVTLDDDWGALLSASSSSSTSKRKGLGATRI